MASEREQATADMQAAVGPSYQHIVGWAVEQRTARLRLERALRNFTEAAESWHSFHKHDDGIQCDRLCECIAPARAALEGKDS